MQDQNPLICVGELESRIGDSGVRVVDCRFELMKPDAGRAEYLAGHIPGAVYADLDKDLAAPVAAGTGRHPLPEPDTLARTFGQFGISRDTHVVVYDEVSGALAARAWWLLRWLGHESVRLLEGGIESWRARQLPIEQGGVDVMPQVFAAAPRDEMVLRSQEIVDAGADCSSLRLLDARDEARFRGDSEPIDVVAGHIPGALNLPFSSAQNSDGSWKTREELTEILSHRLGNDRHAPWSVMCGSGVTACHLVISGLLAGLNEPRLYVGSWSEWITDTGRPIATGGL